MANRVVLGAFEDTFALRVSRPGYNVLDPNLNADKLAFDSRWAEMTSIHMEGYFQFPAVDSSVRSLHTIYHSLGYPPHVITWAWTSSGWLSGFFTYGNNFNITEIKSFSNRVEFRPRITTADNPWMTYYPSGYYVKYCILRMPGDE